MSKKLERSLEAVLDELLPQWRTDPDLAHTPRRMAKMYQQELCAGLVTEPPVMTAFPKPADMDEMVVVGPVTYHSLCPHHFAPIIGHAWVGVIPGSVLLGLSKYARLIRWCAARPAMQETTTQYVADQLEIALIDARGIAVVLKARHLCMEWRGVREPNALTATSAIRGLFRDKADTKAEFMRFVQ